MQTLGIPFRTIPRKRKQLGIPFCGTKIEANSWNPGPKHFAGENTLSILFAGAELFAKHIFPCNFIPLQASELTLL
jgi:hypothetical protein